MGSIKILRKTKCVKCVNFFPSNQLRTNKFLCDKQKMSAENSETDFRPGNEANGVNLFVQNLLTTIILALLNGIIKEFQCWTGRLTEAVQLGWNGFLHE